jgi:hypothetical protein
MYCNVTHYLGLYLVSAYVIHSTSHESIKHAGTQAATLPRVLCLSYETRSRISSALHTTF